jgi:putative toxin-antitoxin system antitoxin component (TIGR02293 family)
MGTTVSQTPTLKEYIGIAPADGLELAEIVERGLPLRNLELLKARGLTFTEMANTVISPRTLKHRKARGEKLSPAESERAIRVASIIRLAERVFGNPEKAMRWLRGSDERLDGRTPLSMLSTDAGGKVVESMLWGIDEGVYS